jgi:hypothetical protein
MRLLSRLCDPFFKGGGIFLADDDLFVHREYQFHTDLASFERFESFDIVGVDDILSVGAVKDVLVQFFFQFAEVAFFRHIFPVLFVYQKDQLVFREEIAGVFYADGLKFNSFSYQDAGPFTVLAAAEVVVKVVLVIKIPCGDEVLVIDKVCPEGPVFFYGVFEFILANRF